jgi:hypothetical protein
MTELIAILTACWKCHRIINYIKIFLLYQFVQKILGTQVIPTVRVFLALVVIYY